MPSPLLVGFPWLPLEYCLNKASPQASEMVLQCPVSVCPQGGLLQLLVITSPASLAGSTAGDAQALYCFPDTFLVQFRDIIEWVGKNK